MEAVGILLRKGQIEWHKFVCWRERKGSGRDSATSVLKASVIERDLNIDVWRWYNQIWKCGIWLEMVQKTGLDGGRWSGAAAGAVKDSANW